MYDPRIFLMQMNAWQKASMLQFQMWQAAAEVIWQRTAQMGMGTMSALEATRMFYEKPAAYARAAERAAMAAASGKGHAGMALAALQPVTSKARSNARRLRRRKLR